MLALCVSVLYFFFTREENVCFVLAECVTVVVMTCGVWHMGCSCAHTSHSSPPHLPLSPCSSSSSPQSPPPRLPSSTWYLGFGMDFHQKKLYHSKIEIVLEADKAPLGPHRLLKGYEGVSNGIISMRSNQTGCFVMFIKILIWKYYKKTLGWNE